MTRPPIVAVIVVSLVIAGCGKPQEPPPDILKAQRRAMEKAKGVEQILQQSADERREQADETK
jgi:outer membrane PBP1 activator LpoA protein